MLIILALMWVLIAYLTIGAAIFGLTVLLHTLELWFGRVEAPNKSDLHSTAHAFAHTVLLWPRYVSKAISTDTEDMYKRYKSGKSLF